MLLRRAKSSEVFLRAFWFSPINPSTFLSVALKQSDMLNDAFLLQLPVTTGSPKDLWCLQPQRKARQRAFPSLTRQPTALTIPSIPWGKSRTIPLWRTHLAWPELMNWSIIHCAVLWKSPNWASQHTRALGLAIAKPSSKPENQMSTRVRYQSHERKRNKSFKSARL